MIRNFANPTQPTEELTPEIAGKYVGKFSEEIICLAVQIIVITLKAFSH